MVHWIGQAVFYTLLTAIAGGPLWVACFIFVQIVKDHEEEKPRDEYRRR